MTFTELNKAIEKDIDNLSEEISFLKGKREAYNNIRQTLKNAVEYERQQREQGNN